MPRKEKPSAPEHEAGRLRRRRHAAAGSAGGVGHADRGVEGLLRRSRMRQEQRGDVHGVDVPIQREGIRTVTVFVTEEVVAVRLPESKPANVRVLESLVALSVKVIARVYDAL